MMEHTMKLTRTLLELQQSGRFCDVKLVCSNGIIRGEAWGLLLRKHNGPH